MNLAQAFGQKFQEHKDAIRTRSFEMGGHTFKVRVPLAVEMDALVAAMKEPEPEKVEKYYKELAAPFVEDKKQSKESGIEFTENDVIVSGRSLREGATAKAITERRILEMIKLLVPEEQGFDMSTITYDMVEELFPFAIQLELMERITKTVSPDYKEHRGK